MTMIEKVARAIYADRDKSNSDPWEDAVAREKRYPGTMSPMRREALSAARAAIAAMRGKAPAVLPSLSCDYGHEREDADKAWNAMIDAALAEGGGE